MIFIKSECKTGLLPPVFRLGLPIALEGLVTFMLGCIDTVMIGRCGDTQISAAYMGGQVQLLLQLVSVGIEGAIIAMCARQFGRGDTDGVRKSAGSGALTALSVGVLLTIICIIFPKTAVGFFSDKKEIIDTGADYLGYLCLSFPFFSLSRALIAAMQSVEKTKVGFATSLVALCLKLLFNYMLIFGNLGAQKMGLVGAALATLIARGAEAAILFIYVFLIDKRLHLRIRALLKIPVREIFSFIKHGTPIILSQLVWAVNTLFGSAIIGRCSSPSA